MWLLFVTLAILMWAATSLLYKAGIHDGKEQHICLKYSVCIGLVFFTIALVYLVTRDEPFTIWESAVRYWPMTVFGLVYAVINTISFNGYIHNEATVESPVEGISGGTSTILLIIAYLALGRASSISELLTPLKTAGIVVIMICIILLSTVRNREIRKDANRLLVSAIVLSREFQMLFDGIGVAVGPIFSVYIGEENHSGLRSAFALARKTAIVEGIAVMLVLLVIAPLVPMVLHVEQAELVRWIVTGVRLTALGTTFVSLLYMLTSYYLVIGQILLGVVVCALRDVVLSVCLAVGLGKVLGVWGFFIGLAVAPMFAYALLMVYLTAHYGRKDCPMLFSKVPGDENSYLFNLSTDPEEIIAVQRKVETLLKEHSVEKRVVGQTMLLIEEAYMLIRQMNDNKAVLAECTVNLKPEGVQIISKDDGVSFDMADEDISIMSLGAYTLARYLEKKDFSNRHLTTMSLNRSSFLIKGKD